MREGICPSFDEKKEKFYKLVCESLKKHSFNFKDFDIEKMNETIKINDKNIYLIDRSINWGNLNIISNDANNLNLKEILDIVKYFQSKEYVDQYPECKL